MVTAVFASMLVAMVAVLAQPSSARPAAAHLSAAGVACPAGHILLGPVNNDVGADMMVVDDIGRLTAAYQTSSGLRANLWTRDLPASSGDPQLIRSGEDPNYPDMSPQKRELGIDASGTQTFAWREGGLRSWTGNPSDVMVATRSPGGAWSAPVKVNQGPDAFIDHVQLAVNAAGAAVLTWIRADPGGHEADFEHANVVAAYRPAGSATWLSPTDVARGAGFSKVGIDDTGNATLVYEVEPLHRVRVRRLEPGAGWGASHKISFGTPQFAGNSVLAVSQNGAVTVTWSQNRVYRSPQRQFTRRMTPAGQWLPAVERRGGKSVLDNALAIGGRGSAVVVWRNYWNDVVAQTSHRDGRWRHRVVLAKAQRNLYRYQLEARMNRRGDTLVVWQTLRRHTRNGWYGVLWGRYRPAGGAWAPARRLSPRTGVLTIGWTTAIGPDGTAWLAWGGAGQVGTRRITIC